MSIVSAIFLSLVAGLITAIPGILSEFGKKAPQNIPLLVDIKTFWGKRLTRGEIFWLGFFIHLLIAALFGALYEYLVTTGAVEKPFHLASLLEYAFCFYFLVGGVVFPAVGLGLFGRKEGKTVWYELLITHHLLGFFVWLAIALFPSFQP